MRQQGNGEFVNILNASQVVELSYRFVKVLDGRNASVKSISSETGFCRKRTFIINQKMKS